MIQKPIFQQMPARPMAHCATLTVLPDGSLLSAWFAGSDETAPDVAILSSRHNPRSNEWSPPRVIAEVPDHALGQPIFMLRPNGEIWLFFDVVMGKKRPRTSESYYSPDMGTWNWNSAQPYWQRSLDAGETWGEPQPLFDYPGFMFRSRPVLLPGRILVPVYDENTWQSRMMISDDDGKSWRLTAPLSTPQGNIHPTVVQLTGSRLLAYLRTGGSGGVIWRSESADAGETWSDPTPTKIPNPNAGIDLQRLQSGALALAFNNSSRQRTPLCVTLADRDENWLPARVVQDGEPEFSYPTLAETPDGIIHLVYTYHREHIQHAWFTKEWLRGDDKS